MNKEHFELLKQDLCARLPYLDTMVRWQDEDYHMIAIDFGRVTLVKPFMSITSGSPLITEVKPYLRPMSSMTEEELNEYHSYCRYHNIKGTVIYEDTYKSFDWLNRKMFDYRGLITMNLALESPEGMYN